MTGPPPVTPRPPACTTSRGSTATEPSSSPRTRASARLGGHISSRRLPLIDLETYARRLPDWIIRDRRFADLGLLDEIRVTTPTRTIVDLVPRLGAAALGDVIDVAISRGLTAVYFLGRRLGELRDSGVSGVRRLSEVILDSGGHSRLERRYLALMRRHGLPRPDCQVVHRSDGRTMARVDFQYPGTKVIAEVNGRRGHASEADRAKDARRRNALQQSGHQVLEFLTTDVIGDEDYVVRTVRAALSLAL